MATINSTIKMVDKASKPINMVEQAVKKVDNAMDDVNQGSAKQPGTGFFGGLSGQIITLNQAIDLAQKGMRALKGMANFADSIIMDKARLDLMNDGLQTTAELQDLIYDSAKRARGSLGDMTGMISKLGLMAGDAFGSSKELVGFTELLQKSFTISGADSTMIESAMYNLTQAMSMGYLQGNDYKAIASNAPMLLDAIAKKMDVTKGELKDLGSQGKITADIVKAALFDSASDINDKFAEMPMTFEQAGTMVKNAWRNTMRDVTEKISEAFNSEKFQNFLRIVISGIEQLGSIIGPVISTIMNMISSLTDFIVDNWGIISNILIILGILMLPGIISAIWTMISAWVIAGAKALLAGIKMFVAAMMALGPIGLIIVVILAVIAILKMLGVSFEKIFSFIGGVVGVTIAVIMNIFIGLYNAIVTIINGIAYGFEMMGWGIRTGITAVVNFVLDQVLKVAKILDKVFGSDLSSKVKDMQSNMKKWAGDMPEWKEVIETQDYVDLTAAWDKGSDIGGKLGKGLDDGIGKLGNMFSGLGSFGDSDFNFDDVYNNGSLDTNVTGGKLDEVNISDEDLKMLKDIATKEYMVNYKRITPNINIEFGDVRETADVNDIMNSVRKAMEEELAELYVIEEA